jgi:hypothetical protein
MKEERIKKHTGRSSNDDHNSTIRTHRVEMRLSTFEYDQLMKQWIERKNSEGKLYNSMASLIRNIIFKNAHEFELVLDELEDQKLDYARLLSELKIQGRNINAIAKTLESAKKFGMSEKEIIRTIEVMNNLKTDVQTMLVKVEEFNPKKKVRK